MKTRVKVWLWAAAGLLLLGIVLAAAAFVAGDFNFRALGTVKMETNTQTVDEQFTDVEVITDTADVIFARSADGICRVECREAENMRHRVSVENGKLTVAMEDSRRWYEYMDLAFESPVVTVYLTEAAYEMLLITTNTGDAELPKGISFADVFVHSSTGNFTCSAGVENMLYLRSSTGDVVISADGGTIQTVEIAAGTGDVTVMDLKCEMLTTVGSTGEIGVTDLVAEGMCKIVRSTGDVTLENCEAKTLEIETDTGDVTLELCGADAMEIKTDTGDVAGHLTRPMLFYIDTSTGDVDVPRTTSGGVCDVKTSTGDISFEICE